MDTRETPQLEPFQVTDAMKRRFEGRLAEYISAMQQARAVAGEDPYSLESIWNLTSIETEMRVPERSEWMHPRRAIATFVMWGDSTLSAGGHLDMRDATRTRWALSEKEWSKALADQMGNNHEYTIGTYGLEHDDKATRHKDLMRAKTAVYRHYDAAGELLYLGITCNMKSRGETHSVLSPWWKYVADSKLEWFPDRASALEAEENAIIAELPIFNIQHVREANAQRRQADYLSWAK